MLSAQYLLIPFLLASERFCFYREDTPELCTMGSIYVSETFLVFLHPTIFIIFTDLGEVEDEIFKRRRETEVQFTEGMLALSIALDH